MAISYQSTNSQKVPSYPTVRLRPETEALSLELQAAQPSSSVTPTTERRPELDFHPEPEEPFQATAEPWLELLLVVEEPTSQFAKLVTHTTDGKQREEEPGQELEVLL